MALQGSGTPASPYLISSVSDFLEMPSYSSLTQYPCFKQTVDLDFIGVTIPSPALITNLNGQMISLYDGNYKIIANATINIPNDVNDSGASLLGGCFTTINLTCISCIMHGGKSAATIAGLGSVNNVHIIDCYVETHLQGSDFTYTCGGMIGRNTGADPVNCSVVGTTLEGLANTLGGITGHDSGATRCMVRDCYIYSRSTYVTTQFPAAGGICGMTYAMNDMPDYTDCCVFNTTISSARAAGGICGFCTYFSFGGSAIGYFTRCYTADITVSAPYAGGDFGIVSTSQVTQDCYSSHVNTITFTYRSVGQLQYQPNFINWDFSQVWNIISTVNRAMPHLRSGYLRIAPPLLTLEQISEDIKVTWNAVRLT